MTVTPIPFEKSRFFVSSESRSGVDHVVDLDWRDEKWHKPQFWCGCEVVQAQGFTWCKHMIKVAQLECERVGVVVLAEGKGIMRITTNAERERLGLCGVVNVTES